MGSGLEIVKRVIGFPVKFGGEEHTGWLPAGAAKPLPTPVRNVLLNIEIQSDGSGFVLCHSSQDGVEQGDTWHPSVAEAEKAAAEYFGVLASHWEIGKVSVAPSG